MLAHAAEKLVGSHKLVGTVVESAEGVGEKRPLLGPTGEYEAVEETAIALALEKQEPPLPLLLLLFGSLLAL